MAKPKGKGKKSSKGKNSDTSSKKSSNKSSNKKFKPIQEPEHVFKPPLTNLEKFELLISHNEILQREPRKLSLPYGRMHHLIPLRQYHSMPSLLPSYEYDWNDLCTPFFHGVPAFQSDVLPDKPHICLWQYFTKEDLKQLMEIWHVQNDGADFLVKKLPQESDDIKENLLLHLLREVLHFTHERNMTAKKTAAYLSIVYLSHNFFRSSLWHTADELYSYIKEAFLLHTIQRPPKSVEIFDPEECRSGLLFFCKMYLRHLPLVQLTVIPNHRLLLEWEAELIPPIEEKSPEKLEDKPSKKAKDKKERGGKKKSEGKKKKKK